MKKVSYKKLSNKRCIECNKPLKQNLVNSNPNSNKCYCCYNISKGKTTTVRNRYKLGELINTKTINYLEIQKVNKRTYGTKRISR